MTRSPAAVTLALIFLSCAGSSGTGTIPAAPTPQAASADSGAVAGASCGAGVVIAFYTDSRCEPGTEVGRRRYDTGQPCFSWTAAGSHAQQNSATRFQCYRDRLCYTQHPGTLACGGGGLATDKESRTDQCLKEPAGILYSKILSGTESCPEAPAGFECPRSAPGAGTTGVTGCTR